MGNSDGALQRRTRRQAQRDPARPGSVRVAAWLVGVPATLVVLALAGLLVWAGVWALMLGPLVLPPMVLFFFEARHAVRLGRGEVRSAVPVALLCVLTVPLLIAVGVAAWPESRTGPKPWNGLSSVEQWTYLLGGGVALVQCAGAGLLLRSGTLRRREARQEPLLVQVLTVAIIAIGLIAFAVANLAQPRIG